MTREIVGTGLHGGRALALGGALTRRDTTDEFLTETGQLP